METLNRRDFIKYTGYGVVAVTSGCNGFSSHNTSQNKKTNVVWILADDLGYGVLVKLKWDTLAHASISLKNRHLLIPQPQMSFSDSKCNNFAVGFQHSSF